MVTYFQFSFLWPRRPSGAPAASTCRGGAAASNQRWGGGRGAPVLPHALGLRQKLKSLLGSTGDFQRQIERDHVWLYLKFWKRNSKR